MNRGPDRFGQAIGQPLVFEGLLGFRQIRPFGFRPIQSGLVVVDRKAQGTTPDGVRNGCETLPIVSVWRCDRCNG